MPTQKIEDAVLAPYKWDAEMRSEEPQETQTLLLNLRPRNYLSTPEVDYSITCLVVVPGGRYIISLNVAGWLECWDVEAPGCRAIASYLIQMDGRSPHDDQIMAQRSAESSSVLIVACKFCMSVA